MAQKAVRKSNIDETGLDNSTLRASQRLALAAGKERFKALCTLEEISKAYPLDHRTVVYWMERGVFYCEKFGNTWVVDVASWRSFYQKRYGDDDIFYVRLLGYA